MDRHKKCREKRISNGLCASCGSIREDTNFRTCQTCRNKGREHGIEWRKNHKETGICDKCSKRPVQHGHTECGYCLRKKAVRAASRYGERYRKGLCEICGKQPYISGQKRCQDCIDRSNQNYAQKADKLTGIRKQRREQGLCSACGINLCETYECKDCRRKKNLAQLKNRYDGNALKALERDNFQCRLCGKSDRLHIHHVDGNGDRQENPNHSLENLITLCRSCHISISNLRAYKANLELVIFLLSA